MILTILITILSLALFTLTFFKMIKTNSTNYIYLLIVEFIGISIDFIVLFIGKKASRIGNAVAITISIIIPIIVFALEKKGLKFDEIINTMSINIKGAENKEHLLKIIEKTPKSYSAHLKLAEYYEKSGEKNKAQDEYIKVIQIKEDDYKIYCKLARLFHEDKKDDEATETLQMLMKLKPDYYDGAMLLGNILYENEKFKEAILVYNDILKYKPAEFDIYYNLGMTYTRLNDFTNAKECYKKAATVNSLKDISNLTLGEICLLFKEYEEAEKYFFESTNGEDEKVASNSYFYLAKIKMLQNNKEQAIQYLNLALELYPKIIKKIENDEILIPIMGKIDIKGNREVSSKITEKEEEIINYLGNTFNVVETLISNTSKSTIDKDREE